MLLAFVATLSVLSTLGLVGTAPIAAADGLDPAVPVPTLTAVTLTNAGLSYSYAPLGPLPAGTSIQQLQYDVSKDGGTTWASSTTANPPFNPARDYYGSTTDTSNGIGITGGVPGIVGNPASMMASYQNYGCGVQVSCIYKLRVVVASGFGGTSKIGGWSQSMAASTVAVPTLDSATIVANGVQLGFTNPPQAPGLNLLIVPDQLDVSTNLGQTWTSSTWTPGRATPYVAPSPCNGTACNSPATVSACVTLTCSYRVRVVISFNTWVSYWSNTQTVSTLQVASNPTPQRVDIGQPFTFSASAAVATTSVGAPAGTAVTVSVVEPVAAPSVAVTVWSPATRAVQEAPVHEPSGVIEKVVSPVTSPREVP